ncbi:MAG: hypothetical protein PHP70_05045 [Gallionella sp.]|nr:hypothetical protein [Gallionella sp.]
MIITAASDFLSHLSFWWFLVGAMLLLMRGMGPPGVKSIDKKKFYEVKAEIEEKLNAKREMVFLEVFLLYCGKYFFVYHYYRNDLIFYWFIGGALFMKILSLLIAP